MGLFQFKCTGIQLVIGALLGHQLAVGSSLDDPSMIQDHDAVCIHDGA